MIRFVLSAEHRFFGYFNIADIAWEIITDFANELLEKEHADEITEILDRKRKETLAQKRSFFVRMVSDPKIYNPAINKAGTPRISSESYSPITEGAPSIQTPTSKYMRLNLIFFDSSETDLICIQYLLVHLDHQLGLAGH